ncbi:MAG: tRNA dihydrouridine synthase DusB [Bacteroidia bacterium]|nr:tRNA dihydrouridine synthase DusB [Bacteroidia bacterium]
MVRIGNVVFEDFPLLLAPMEDVSDPPFRKVCKQNGADMMYTEFISTEGLVRDASKSIKKLDIYDYERPIGIQIFGDKIEVMRKGAEIAAQSNPDVLDINYGCPVKNVACKGAGAALLQDLPKMQKMTEEIVKAVHPLPVTVKTRLGWDSQSINIIEAVLRLQDVGVQAVTIHARTRAQMYKGQADWTYIRKVKEHPQVKIPIFGNGDIDSPQKALAYKNEYLPDGIMIGRASIGYPWIFREIKHYFKTGELLPPPTLQERVDTCKQHLQFSIQWKGEVLGVLEMRRHYSNYFKNIPNIKPYRNRLVTETHIPTLFAILDEILENEKVFSVGILE